MRDETWIQHLVLTAWLLKHESLCQQCAGAAVETELHFFTQCPTFYSIRKQSFPKFINNRLWFNNCSDDEKLQIGLREVKEGCEGCLLSFFHFYYSCIFSSPISVHHVPCLSPNDCWDWLQHLCVCNRKINSINCKQMMH